MNNATMPFVSDNYLNATRPDVPVLYYEMPGKSL